VIRVERRARPKSATIARYDYRCELSIAQAAAQALL
jgi:hypothetical protein